MPTYDYACNDCDYRFEEFHSITAAPLDKCPNCNGTVQRLISAGTGLIFKGSGFYITDYKKSKGANGTADSSTPKKKSEAKPDSATAKSKSSSSKKED